MSRVAALAALLALLAVSPPSAQAQPTRETATPPPPPRGPASPMPPPPRRPVPRPFERGWLDFGLSFGVSTGQGQTAVSLGGTFGYFVLPGLEPGITVDASFGSGVPTVVGVLPFLRFVLWRSYAFSPYIKAQGGRFFVSGGEDLTALGGGGGAVIFLSRRIGLQAEALVYKLFPKSVCQDSCVTTDVGLTFGIFWAPGGSSPPRRRRRRPAPPPAPPPPAAAPPATATPPAASPPAKQPSKRAEPPAPSKDEPSPTP